MSTSFPTIDSGLLKSIHASLQAALGGGGFLALDLRHHTLDPERDPENPQDPEAACGWARLLNDVPLPSLAFRSSGRQVGEVVESVLTQGELDPGSGTRANVAWWKEMMAKLVRARRRLPSGKAWEATRTNPAYASFFGDRGWTRYEFTFEPFPGLGGGTAAVHVSARLLRVSIVRPWLDALLFRARWDWKPGAADRGTLISDGVFSPDGALPSGIMPLLPMAVILARDVEISVQQDAHTRRAGQVGPFARSGSAPGTPGGTEGVQIVAWVCTVLPRCPCPRDGYAEPGCTP